MKLRKKHLLLPLPSLFAGIFFLFVGNGLYIASAGVQLSSLNYNNIIIGLVNSSYFVGALLSGLSAHRIIASVGHIRSFMLFVAVIGLCMLAHTLWINMAAWSVFRFVQGFCYYSLLMVAESWLNAKVSDRRRSRTMAYYEITFYLAFVGGALLLAFDLSLQTTFIIGTMFMLLASIPLGLTRVQQPEVPSAPEHISVPRLANIVALSWLGCFVAGIIINGFFTMATVFVIKQGFNVQQASTFLIVALIGGFLMQLPIGRYSDRCGRRVAIIIASGIACVSSISLLLIQFTSLKESMLLQYLIIFFFGNGSFCIYSLSVARANDVVNHRNIEHNVLEISRGLLFVYSLGSLLGPLLLGFAMNYCGAAGFGLIFSLCSTSLFIFALSRQSIPKEDRIKYIPTPKNASIIMVDIDPRTDE